MEEEPVAESSVDHEIAQDMMGDKSCPEMIEDITFSTNQSRKKPRAAALVASKNLKAVISQARRHWNSMVRSHPGALAPFLGSFS